MYTDLINDGKVATPKDILWEGQYYPYGLAHNGAWMDTPDKDLNYKYNGIELADDFGLNVNLATFRTLDPATGRWWQVNPKVELQYSMSLYSAMNNNPILYTDPNGDNPLLIGAAVGFLSNGISNIAQGNNFFQEGLQAAALGAIGGAGSAVIGGATSGITSGIGRAAAQLAGHSLTGGLNSVAQGGNFLQGAAAGGFSSLTGSAIGENSLGQWLGGGLSGGVGSSIAGGSFLQGAGQGLLTGGLNHAAHEIEIQIKVLQLSKRGAAFIAKHEAFRGQVYLDQAGLPTIGYGHLLKSGENFPNGISQTDALKLLHKDARIAVKAVNKHLKIQANQHQFDAMTSLTFNIGTGGFAQSSVLKHFNQGNFQAASNSFALWNKITLNGQKVVSRGLTHRRTSEALLFSTGKY